MRRFLALFMILLLAARGLLGDAMAMGLADAASSHPVAAMTAHAGHDGMTMVQTEAAHCNMAADQDQDTASHTCDACGICHSALANPAALMQQGLAPPAGLNTAAATRFASAALAQATKPPIS